MSKKILIFENTYALTNYLVKKWAEVAEEAIGQRGRFVAALSGGKTPVEFYCKLSSIPNFEIWKDTHVFLTDERFVALNDDESNFQMISELMLHYANIPEENVHPVDTSVESTEEASLIYEQELKDFFPFEEQGIPRFDFMLLGVGEDGHTASLFPNTPVLQEQKRWVAGVEPHGFTTPRVTLTYPIINQARNVLFLVQGTRKAEIMKRIFKEHEDVPAGHVNLEDGQQIFLLDKEAAKQLSYLSSFTLEDEAICLEV